MADAIFIIAWVALAGGIAMAIVFMGFKEGPLAELAAEEWEEMQDMNCKEITAKDASGLYWSTDNAKWAREKVKACASAP